MQIHWHSDHWASNTLSEIHYVIVEECLDFLAMWCWASNFSIFHVSVRVAQEMLCWQTTPKSQWLKTTRLISCSCFMCIIVLWGVGCGVWEGAAPWRNSETSVAIHRHCWSPYRAHEFYSSVSHQHIRALTWKWHILFLTTHWQELVTWHNPWDIRYWTKEKKWVT